LRGGVAIFTLRIGCGEQIAIVCGRTASARRDKGGREAHDEASL
jgi:hypothetical protein